MENEYPVEKRLPPSISEMTLFEAIATRRSIKKFSSQDVPMELIGQILDAGRYAPSSGNVQNWKFILVRDRDVINSVTEGCMDQNWIAQAPALIVVCSSLNKVKSFYGTRGEMLYSIQNCAAAIQNMLLTTHSIGLASSWVSLFDERVINRVLNIPSGDVRAQAILPIGYPDEIVPAPTRYTLENVCYFNSYGSRIINIERVMQNPIVLTKLARLAKSVVEPIKDTLNRKKQ